MKVPTMTPAPAELTRRMKNYTTTPPPVQELTWQELQALTLAELMQVESDAQRRADETARQHYRHGCMTARRDATERALYYAKEYCFTVKLARQVKQYDVRNVQFTPTEGGTVQVSFTASPYLLRLLELDGGRHDFSPEQTLHDAITQAISDTEERIKARPAV